MASSQWAHCAFADLQVIEWCTHHREDPVTQDDQERRNTDIEEWDQKYMEVDQETLFDIILVSTQWRQSEHGADELLLDK